MASQDFQDIGDDEEKGLDVLRLGPAKDMNGNDIGFYVLSGALIHIDIDFGATAKHNSRDEALRHAEEVMIVNKHCGAIYHTYGGIRVIITDMLAWPVEREDILNSFEVDPIYKAGCLKLNQWRIRVTPKQGRIEDVIALEYATYGKGADIPENMRNIHDRLCGAHRDSSPKVDWSILVTTPQNRRATSNGIASSQDLHIVST